jgi:hypothetical protein
MITLSNLQSLKDTFAIKGYQWENFHLIGVRSKDYVPNTFCDNIYLIDGDKAYSFHATTRPGRHWLLNLLNPKGTAVLKEGQYKNSWRLGLHQGKYTALVQAAPVTVFRDANKDEKADAVGVVDTGIFGINIHRANQNMISKIVDKWSAGCQVIQDPTDFNFLIKKCRDSGKGVFTYTLLNEI